MDKEFETRFWKKVIKQESNECWGWIGNTSSFKGSGSFEFRCKKIAAKTASWIIHFGEIPKGKLVWNICGNKACVNPNHLILINKSEWNKDIRPIEQRFYENVVKTEYCWEWVGGKFSGGYGSFRFDDKNRKAHRIAWMLAHGTMPPDNLLVCHKCDNPSCVNPDHLFLGTNQDNIVDMVTKGRGNFIYGEKQPNHKLTAEDVLLIRKLYRLGASTQIQLAKDFDMSFQQINRIVNNQRWTHLQHEKI